LPYAKKEDKAAQMREYRELLKQKAKKDYIEKSTADVEKEVKKSTAELETKILRFIIETLIENPEQNKPLRQLAPEVKKLLETTLPKALAEFQTNARERAKQEIAEHVPELEKSFDESFDKFLAEAQSRLSKAELEKRLIAAYKGIADESQIEIRKSQSELEKIMKKFYLV